MGSDGDEKLFLQALIQLAAACVHLTRGSAGPGIRLLSLSREKLGHLGDAYAAIDTELLRRSIAEAQEQLRKDVPAGEVARSIRL